ncbi:GSCFA domain-containing protein [Winogradskyella sp. DF17]|uniref:GSCFA domain-containing protein n=1 Tax=Winogradskyella pelagia TaxID=2819984 RepID=A0ABS3T613_9FLAO|nr:GSCFA domain-containing protein [Winogradskyella sp. DF17]MBO3117729.1 GSCFA domain-containing protein [Winogradskyella sp. DF17]
MKLQTQISVQKQRHNQIDYESKLLLLGSCFSENIYAKLSYFKLNAFANPLGIQFHVYGIERLISRAINKTYFTKDELCNSDGIFYSFDAHSKWNADSADQLCNTLNTQLDITNTWLRTATHLVITLGTAWVYRHLDKDSIVSNCHKVPQKQFLKELLSVNELSESLDGILELVRNINPNVTFIYTVSPVRHLKDGFVENNRSKAHLLASIHKVVNPRNRSYYFPSYEIQMDELRDYRFYETDMLHPNQLAIDIIWKRFTEAWLTNEAIEVKEKVDVIQKGFKHRPFQPSSKSYSEFKDSLSLKVKDLQDEFPQIRF